MKSLLFNDAQRVLGMKCFLFVATVRNDAPSDKYVLVSSKAGSRAGRRIKLGVLIIPF